MLTRIGNAVLARLEAGSPWTNVYGLARTMLAGATLLTLVFSDTSTLFRPSSGRSDFPYCDGAPSSYGLFCLPLELPVLQWLAIAALVVIASGWRPRLTGALHWWIAASYSYNASLIDGGDQVNQILTLLLVPVTLTDARRWHWQAPEAAMTGGAAAYLRMVTFSAMLLIRLQVAGIYFHAAIGKFAVQQWANGTALYYWLQDGVYGAPPWLQPLVIPLVRNGTTVALVTWGTMLLEYLLGAALFIRPRYRPTLLCAGFALHGGILFVQGISSFSLTMMAALVLYLHPWTSAFTFPTFVFPSWRRRQLSPAT